MTWLEIVKSVGPGGALLGVVWMVMRGAIVPRSTLDDVRADRDARLAEKQAEIAALRDTVQALQSTCSEQADQVTTLLEVGRTARHVLLSLPTGVGGDTE